MSDNDDNLAHINPLLRDAVERITVGMAECFDEVWSRDDAVDLCLKFLDGELLFCIDRYGITIAEGVPSGGDAVN